MNFGPHCGFGFVYLALVVCDPVTVTPTSTLCLTDDVQSRLYFPPLPYVASNNQHPPSKSYSEPAKLSSQKRNLGKFYAPKKL